MQTTTTISLPNNLAREVEKQIIAGRFSSRSEFIRSAVRTYLTFQKGELSWEVLAAPFRTYAKRKKMQEKDILHVVTEGRCEKTSKNCK